MRQTCVVWGREGVSKNQVDNLKKGSPMIGKLTGILLEKNPPQILVDCNGVGYEVDVPMTTYYNLPGTGERVSQIGRAHV